MPVSTPGFDAAPYLTATLCVTRDPDTGIQNMGTYRAQLKATDRLGVRMASRIGGAGGYLHWQKHSKRGKPMPCAIVIGCAPVVMFTGGMKLPIDLDEMAVAGGLAGAPIRIAKAVTVDLNVPADAEIVIEGLIDPELLEPEGPFGESHGHVALEDFNMSMRVTAITHKRSPVFVSIVSQVTPSESSVLKKVAMEPLFLTHLRDQLGDQGRAARGAARAALESAQGHLRAICARHAAHRSLARTARRATLLADCGKICIAVSEDIDPAQCRRGVLVARLPGQPGRGRACCAPPLRRAWAEIRAAQRGIDAADRRDAASIRRRRSPCRRATSWSGRVRSGRSCGLPALTPQPPWHGYSLGDWSERWDVYAARAVAGRWEESGDGDLRAPPRRPHSRRLRCARWSLLPVVPAKAGTYNSGLQKMGPRFRGDDIGGYTTTVSRLAARVMPV